VEIRSEGPELAAIAVHRPQRVGERGGSVSGSPGMIAPGMMSWATWMSWAESSRDAGPDAAAGFDDGDGRHDVCPDARRAQLANALVPVRRDTGRGHRGR
jgi:hypothetical protein